MKANELRIGNIVKCNAGELPHYLEVSYLGAEVGGDFIDNNYEEYLSHKYEGSYENIEPIPLTPEILEKAGFKLHSKHSYWNYFNERRFVISMWMEDQPFAGFEKKGSCYWGDNYIEITYLHQLQNLYYALTGEELNIQL